MINGSTLPVTSGNFRCSSLICNVPVRSLLSLKQTRLIAASATISSSAAQSSVSALDSEIPIKERKRAEKSESFFNLFREYGFEDSEIEKFSMLGHLSVEKLKPKLDYLVEIGVTGELLHNLIVSNPSILRGSLDARIKPNVQLLKQYLDSNEKVVRSINRHKWILNRDLELCFIPNIELLINEGVAVDRVIKLLLSNPGVFTVRRDRMPSAVKTVRELGVAPNDTMFIRCIRIVCTLSESSLKKKLEFFKSLGWSDEQVSNVVKKCPGILGLSEENLKSKMRFYVNILKLEPETVIGNPQLLGSSVDMVYARCEVLKFLKSQKLIRGVSVVTAAAMSEDRFVNYYVIRHEDSVPGLLDMYNALLTKEGTISTTP